MQVPASESIGEETHGGCDGEELLVCSDACKPREGAGGDGEESLVCSDTCKPREVIGRDGFDHVPDEQTVDQQKHGTTLSGQGV